MKEIHLDLPGTDASYRLVIEPGLRLDLSRLIIPLQLSRHLFLVADRKVARLYGAAVEKTLKVAGFHPVLLTVPPGERSKTWPVVQRLARELLSLRAYRASVLIALGGGVVGDLTGFLASIFMRGLAFVQVPTTLLAMVDAAIGGKTAIDLPEGKNLLGTFHQPRLVVIDPEFLATLPRAEKLNGLAEVVKAGFIRDQDLLTRLAQEGPLLSRRLPGLTEIIYQAAAIKARVVSQDEREGDIRRILNFGHTIGHGLEQAAHFRLPHGQAVAWGMLAALSLSVQLAGLSPAEAEYGRRLLMDLGLLRPLPPVNREVVLAAMATDKKRTAEGLTFVLLPHLGEAMVLEGVPVGAIRPVLAEILPN